MRSPPSVSTASRLRHAASPGPPGSSPPRREIHACLVTGEYPPAIGGIADYTALLAQNLRELGVRVTVLTQQRNDGASEDIVTVEGWGFASLAEIAGRIGEIKPDIVHLQYQAAAFGMSPAIYFLPFAARETSGRPRFITTFHDLRVPYLFPGAGGLRRAAARVLLGASDGAIFTSQADLVDAAPRGRAAWIPIGPGIAPRGRGNRAAARDRFHIDANVFVIAYFGFMNATKGVETLLEAGARLERTGLDFQLLIIGDDQGVSDPTNVATTARLHSLESQLGLEARIIRTGWLPAKEITRALSAADVAALPYADGASLRRSTMVTCFAHGVPVVTTTPATQPNVPARHLVEPFDQPGQFHIDEHVAAIVPPGDPAALADELRRLADEPSQRKALARAGRQLGKRLTWPDVAHATVGFYHSTLGTAR